MNWFRNLSIIKKLLLSFAIVGGMGAGDLRLWSSTIRAMVRSNAALYEHGACSLDQVTNLSTSYQQVLVTLRDVVRSANAGGHAPAGGAAQSLFQPGDAKSGLAGIVRQLARGR